MLQGLMKGLHHGSHKNIPPWQSREAATGRAPPQARLACARRRSQRMASLWLPAGWDMLWLAAPEGCALNFELS